MSTLAQFSSGIKSIQRVNGAIGGGGASTTFNISAVNTSKTMVSYLGSQNSTSSAGAATNTAIASMFCTIQLTSSTTVLAQRTNASGALFLSFEIIEFY